MYNKLLYVDNVARYSTKTLIVFFNIHFMVYYNTSSSWTSRFFSLIAAISYLIYT